MAWATVLVRYGEIGIKSREVRERFERKLRENLEAQLVARGAQGMLSRERGRLLLETPDPERALDAVAHTFGVVSGSLAEPLPGDLEAMARAAGSHAPRILRPGQSFAVRARRSGSEPYTSMDMAKEAGSAIWKAMDGKVRVDLGAPDVEVFLEARGPRAFLFTTAVPGPGGLPLGTQGRVIAALEDARAVHALWLALRRGASAAAFAWDPMPPDVTRAVDALAAWAPGLRVPTVAPPPGGPTRAAALAVARSLAWKRRAYAVVVGDGLAGFERLAALDPAAKVPVFRPLTGWAGKRLEELAARDGLPGPLDEAMPPAGEAPDEAWVRAAAEAVR